jgi:hypothetical protein
MKVKTFKASFYIVGYLLEPDVESGGKKKKKKTFQILVMKTPQKKSQILHF